MTADAGSGSSDGSTGGSSGDGGPVAARSAGTTASSPGAASTGAGSTAASGQASGSQAAGPDPSSGRPPAGTAPQEPPPAPPEQPGDDARRDTVVATPASGRSSLPVGLLATALVVGAAGAVLGGRRFAGSRARGTRE